MIRNIVFDMGQVLIHFIPVEISRKAGVPEEALETFVEELFESPEWARLDRGSITQEEAYAVVCARLPEERWESARKILYSWWEWALWPMEGMAELMAELKERGYRLYALSNATLSFHGYCGKIPGIELFDGKIISADWKLLKPQHEIYETLYREYGLQPEESFFIDDNPLNIEGAWETGMRGVVFRGDVDRLRRELRQAGISLRNP